MSKTYFIFDMYESQSEIRLGWVARILQDTLPLTNNEVGMVLRGDAFVIGLSAEEHVKLSDRLNGKGFALVLNE
jgi:hypothetical protein